MLADKLYQEKCREVEIHLAFLECVTENGIVGHGLRDRGHALSTFERETCWRTLAELVRAAPDEAWYALDREPERLHELSYEAELRVFDRALRMPAFYDVDTVTLSRRVEHLHSRREDAMDKGDEGKAEALLYVIERIVRVVGYLVRFRSRLRSLPGLKDEGRHATRSMQHAASETPRVRKLRLVPK